MFFKVSCEKSGRPGQSGDVMDAVCDAVSLYLPIHPHNVEKLASTVNGTAVSRGFGTPIPPVPHHR